MPGGFCSAQETRKPYGLQIAMGLLDTASFAERIHLPNVDGVLAGGPVVSSRAAPQPVFLRNKKRMAVYPRHAHERINRFENLQINFLLTYSGGRLMTYIE